MITLYSIVETLNDIINDSLGTLVLHKAVVPDLKFKAYKKFKYNLYLVHNKNKELILTYEITRNISLDKIEKEQEKCDLKFLSMLLNWTSSEAFNTFKS